jgi:hypothetical protein
LGTATIGFQSPPELPSEADTPFYQLYREKMRNERLAMQGN